MSIQALDFLAGIQVQDPTDVETRDHIHEVAEVRKAANPYEVAWQSVAVPGEGIHARRGRWASGRRSVVERS